jgi:hypothetical protein
MLNIRNNILVALTLCLCGTGTSGAATLVSFDRPNLVVVFEKKGTYGYYTGVSIKPSEFSETEKYECTFMFMRVKGPDEVSLRTLDRPIKDWNSAAYAEGSIRVNGPMWQIRFSDRPSGCASKFDHDQIVVPPTGPGADATEYGTRGAYFKVVKKTKAVGIRWVGFDTLIQQRIEGKFVSTGEKLGVGTLVVVLERTGAFSEVQYVNLHTGKNVKVWVHSTKLSDPYPKS